MVKSIRTLSDILHDTERMAEKSRLAAESTALLAADKEREKREREEKVAAEKERKRLEREQEKQQKAVKEERKRLEREQAKQRKAGPKQAAEQSGKPTVTERHLPTGEIHRSPVVEYDYAGAVAEEAARHNVYGAAATAAFTRVDHRQKPHRPWYLLFCPCVGRGTDVNDGASLTVDGVTVPTDRATKKDKR